MELDLAHQVYQASSALLLGLMAGLYYDVLKTFRRRVGRRGATLFLDLLFWLGLFAALFAQTMTTGLGEVRIFMLVTNLLGSLLYFLVFSSSILFFLKKTLDKLLRFFHFTTTPIRIIWLKGKKIAKQWKEDFQNRVKHYIIIKDYVTMKNFAPGRGEGGGQVEGQKGKHIYETGGTGAGRLRGRQSDRSPRANRARKRGPDRTPRGPD